MVKINGAECEADRKTVLAYLESAGYDIKRVAVERNGQIVAKADYADVVLEDGDALEVVRFVGGG